MTWFIENSISIERHAAQVRRATNDETLTSLACDVNGISHEDASREWKSEGRRLIPLLPRTSPRTMLQEVASEAASKQQEINSRLPLLQTAKRHLEQDNHSVRKSCRLTNDVLSTSTNCSTEVIRRPQRRRSFDDRISQRLSPTNSLQAISHPVSVDSSTSRVIFVSNDQLNQQHSRIVSVCRQDNVVTQIVNLANPQSRAFKSASLPNYIESKAMSSLQSSYLQLSKDKSGHLIILPKSLSHNDVFISSKEMPVKSSQLENRLTNNTTIKIDDSRKASISSDQSFQLKNKGKLMTRRSCKSLPNRVPSTSSDCASGNPEGHSRGNTSKNRVFPETFVEVQGSIRGSLDNQRNQEERRGHYNRQLLPRTQQPIPVTQSLSK